MQELKVEVMCFSSQHDFPSLNVQLPRHSSFGGAFFLEECFGSNRQPFSVSVAPRRLEIAARLLSRRALGQNGGSNLSSST